jgi:hypothetical protein
MFVSGNAPHRLHERGPGLSLLGEDAPPLRRDLVEPSASLARFFNPRTLDPPTLLKAIQQGIERIDVEGQLPT